jgi:hypothetical protein
MMLTRSPRRSILFLIALVALIATACGTNSGGETIGVASLEDAAGAGTVTESESEPTPEDAVLEFSQCMRDEGLDFPDIGVDANGNPDIGDAFQSAGIQPGSPDFRDAIAACSEILQGAGFGGGRRAALGDNTELQDAFVELSACIRDQGFDVGDLSFGGGPGGDGQDDGDGPRRGQGEGQGGFGDRSARLAQGLGLDIDDPEVGAALDECEPIIDAALSGLGLGRGPGQG